MAGQGRELYGPQWCRDRATLFSGVSILPEAGAALLIWIYAPRPLQERQKPLVVYTNSFEYSASDSHASSTCRYNLCPAQYSTALYIQDFELRGSPAAGLESRCGSPSTWGPTCLTPRTQRQREYDLSFVVHQETASAANQHGRFDCSWEGSRSASSSCCCCARRTSHLIWHLRLGSRRRYCKHTDLE